ncbi:hypothetical protein AWC38_SpisGene12264 [Stylophora pistillata]|uniref:Uncharacterized protein n=1 Tax=Stylophora pistillata TaxID=50429 RepID=A0A2B4S3P2_STYPI|nr:hypothetical protein AWC38_SpisGene12264 [Stylophora pistillata]
MTVEGVLNPPRLSSVFRSRYSLVIESSILRNPNVYKDVDGPSLISDLRECLQKMESSDEDLIYLDELKVCFASKILSEVNESHIQKLDTVNPLLSPPGGLSIPDQLVNKYLTEEGSQVPLLTLKLLQLLSLCEKLFSSSKGLQETVKKTCGRFPSISSCSTQVECIKLFCCAISHQPGHSSLLGDSHSTSLPAVTINCLLSKDSELQTVGAALVSNIARLKIHEDIALECSTAVIELLTRNVCPETEHNCLYALRRFMDYNSEVAGLLSVMGVNVGKYKGRSSDVDELCRDLEKLLS